MQMHVLQTAVGIMMMITNERGKGSASMQTETKCQGMHRYDHQLPSGGMSLHFFFRTHYTLGTAVVCTRTHCIVSDAPSAMRSAS